MGRGGGLSLPDFDVCWFTGKPCFMFVSRDGERSCLIRNSKGRVLYACVEIRFRGKNSVREQGLGMQLIEKLERQGLIDFIDKKQAQRFSK